MAVGYMKFNNRPLYARAHLQCVKGSHAYSEWIIPCAETVPLIKRLEEKEKKKGERYIMTLEAIFHVLYKPLIIMKMDRAQIDRFR